MFSYSNIYDAIPICRTHARTEHVRKHKFFKRQRERQATILSLVARVVAPCAFTRLGYVPKNDEKNISGSKGLRAGL